MLTRLSGFIGCCAPSEESTSAFPDASIDAFMHSADTLFNISVNVSLRPKTLELMSGSVSQRCFGWDAL